MLALYEDTDRRLRRAGAEASARRKLTTVAEIVQPLQLPKPDVAAGAGRRPLTRLNVFGGKLPEDDPRPRHLAFRIPQALTDLFAAYPNAFLFGEDVAKKGGVYHATTGLFDTFGAGRVFNTILDETTILGLAQGMAQAGCLPFPEIQYLAYIHNALDQIRGEAASLQFFSSGKNAPRPAGHTPAFSNPMVVRIAGLAYQKGFGGHFHNDNSVGALLDIPGLILGVPARADDAVLMLRTMTAAARSTARCACSSSRSRSTCRRTCTRRTTALWQFGYPAPDELMPLGEGRTYGASDDDQLTIVSYGNGLWMSLRVQKLCATRHQGARVRPALARAAADRADQGARRRRPARASSSTNAAPRTAARAR
jgi:2-oxoisovalerate dehydrogenase E1 component